jgi:hypothetical protein
MSKNIKTKIYRTIILPVVLYGCETWSLTLGEERRLRVFAPKSDEVIGEWRRLYIMRSLMISTLHQIFG